MCSSENKSILHGHRARVDRLARRRLRPRGARVGGGAGGAGGGPGLAGAAGQTNNNPPLRSGGPGGAAGASINGVSLVTFDPGHTLDIRGSQIN